MRQRGRGNAEEIPGFPAGCGTSIVVFLANPFRSSKPKVGLAALRQGPSAQQRTENKCMHHSERWLKLGDEVHERVPPLNAAGPAQPYPWGQPYPGLR